MADSKSLSKQKLCGLCSKNISIYCCPRCGVFYCSLDCYKSVSHLECSEDFYKECINEELNLNEIDNESRNKMMEILKRVHGEDVDDPTEIDDILDNMEDSSADSDDGDELDLHERIKNLNLDNPEEVWQALTEDERNEFEAIINQGDVGSIIPHWQPWWSYHKEKKLIEDVAENHENKENKALKNCPKLYTVQKLSTLTSVKPSAAVKFNIINILASYTFIMRYFNGELNPSEITIHLLEICSNLSANANFEDMETAVESVVQKCIQSNLIETDEDSLKVMKDDTFSLLQGPSILNRPYYCKAALSHIHKIFHETKKHCKNEKSKEKKKTSDNAEFSKKFPQHTGEHLPELDLSQVKKCLKKIEYCLSYLEDTNIEI